MWTEGVQGFDTLPYQCGISVVCYWGDPSRSSGFTLENRGSFHRFWLTLTRPGIPQNLQWTCGESVAPKCPTLYPRPKMMWPCYILLGGLEHGWMMTFHSVGNGMSSSQPTFTPSFFRGVGWNHQPESHMLNTMFPMRWSGALKWHLPEGCRKCSTVRCAAAANCGLFRV